MSNVIREIDDERHRQITAEGYDASHDDDHAHGDLAMAAACYTLNAARASLGRIYVDSIPSIWPWPSEFWKPRGPRRDLVRAAALIVAEIERLDRASVGKAASQK